MQVCFCRVPTIMVFVISITSCEQKQADIPPISFEENLQQQLIEAESGDVIEIPSGVHRLYKKPIPERIRCHNKRSRDKFIDFILQGSTTGCGGVVG